MSKFLFYTMRFFQWLLASLAYGIFLIARLFPWQSSSNFGGWVARTIGPKLKVSNIARDNLRAAYPDKTADEIETMVHGVWDNLGRTAAEYPHLDRIWDYDPENPDRPGRIEVVGIDHFNALRHERKPAIIFTCHKANWELLAVCAAKYDLPVAVLFRRPNNPYINRLIHRIRGQNMGELLPSGLGAAIASAKTLEAGRQVGILVDQHFTRGPALPFFGRPAHTSPTLAKLLRRYDCAVHGAHVERLPDNRFRLTISAPMTFERSDDRRQDIALIMSKVNETIEEWIRARPEQWLWLHRRWREIPGRTQDAAKQTQEQN